MSSVRGRDQKDRLKTMNNRARYDVAYSKDNSVNKFRPDTFLGLDPKSNPNMLQPEVNIAPVKRGGDVKDMVKDGRDQQRQQKSNSTFTRFSVPTNSKIVGYGSTGGAIF